MTTFPGTPPSGTGGGTADVSETLDAQMIAIEVADHGGAIVISVAGEVDMVTTPHLNTCLQEQLALSPDRLVVDLSELSFLGSSGLAVLVESLDDARSRGTDLRLVCSSREVVRPLEATGLTELFQTFPDLDSALAG